MARILAAIAKRLADDGFGTMYQRSALAAAHCADVFSAKQVVARCLWTIAATVFLFTPKSRRVKAQSLADIEALLPTQADPGVPDSGTLCCRHHRMVEISLSGSGEGLG